MSNADQSRVRKRGTTLWTRRFIFSCHHYTDHYWPIQDPSGQEDTSKSRMPLLMPLRVSRDCNGCLRRAVLDRAQAKAVAVRACFNTLCARVPGPVFVSNSNKHDDDDDYDDDDDESWPEKPLSLSSFHHLLHPSGERFVATGLSTGADAPKEKLSERIHTIRLEFERMRESWDAKDKNKVSRAARGHNIQ